MSPSRLDAIAPARPSGVIRFVFSRVRKMYGRVPSPSRLMARNPRVFWANFLIELGMRRMDQLPPRTRALVQVKASQVIGCRF